MAIDFFLVTDQVHREWQDELEDSSETRTTILETEIGNFALSSLDKKLSISKTKQKRPGTIIGSKRGKL